MNQKYISSIVMSTGLSVALLMGAASTGWGMHQHQEKSSNTHGPSHTNNTHNATGHQGQQHHNNQSNNQNNGNGGSSGGGGGAVGGTGNGSNAGANENGSSFNESNTIVGGGSGSGSDVDSVDQSNNNNNANGGAMGDANESDGNNGNSSSNPSNAGGGGAVGGEGNGSHTGQHHNHSEGGAQTAQHKARAWSQQDCEEKCGAFHLCAKASGLKDENENGHQGNNNGKLDPEDIHDNLLNDEAAQEHYSALEALLKGTHEHAPEHTKKNQDNAGTFWNCAQHCKAYPVTAFMCLTPLFSRVCIDDHGRVYKESASTHSLRGSDGKESIRAKFCQNLSFAQSAMIIGMIRTQNALARAMEIFAKVNKFKNDFPDTAGKTQSELKKKENTINEKAKAELETIRARKANLQQEQQKLETQEQNLQTQVGGADTNATGTGTGTDSNP